MPRIRNESRNGWTSSGCTTVSPSGFWKSEAILATSLLGPTPTEAVSPSWLTISALSRRARPTAASKLPSDERSRYASSTLVFWKASPAAARIAMILAAATMAQSALTSSMRYDAAHINRFDLTRYPDYRGDLPPDVYQLHRFGHLDEYEAEWGRRWGANGIGRLCDVALSRPTEYEVLDIWLKHPKFFLLRYSSKIDFDALLRNHQDYEKLLRS